jgi:branched-chain amino acid transport system permease protein
MGATILQLLVAGLTVGAVYTLIALGFVTVYRCSGVTNFAQGEFVMLGSLITFWTLSKGHVVYPVSMLVGVVGVAIVGVLLYQFAVRPLRGNNMMPTIITTLGASIFFVGVAQITMGGYEKGLPAFMRSVKSFSVAGIPLPLQSVWVILAAVGVLLVLQLFNNWTLFGMKMTATATQPSAALLCGVSRRKMITWSFAISAAVGAIGGICLGTIVPLNYASGSIYTLKGFAAAVLGGWGKSTGAIVGGFIIGIVETVSVLWIPAGYRDAVAFVVLLIILYFRPVGILGASLVEGAE